MLKLKPEAPYLGVTSWQQFRDFDLNKVIFWRSTSQPSSFWMIYPLLKEMGGIQAWCPWKISMIEPWQQHNCQAWSRRGFIGENSAFMPSEILESFIRLPTGGYLEYKLQALSIGWNIFDLLGIILYSSLTKTFISLRYIKWRTLFRDDTTTI